MFAMAMTSLMARAQPYPNKPIRLIVQSPAGGTADFIARLIAQRMSETMGQPVTVENKGGAGGAIGADAVAKAKANCRRGYYD